MAISGAIGAIYKASGTSTTFTNAAMTNTGDNKRYKITDATKAYWDTSAAVTVKVDGSTVTSGFTIEYAGGNVVFTASQGASVVTVTGKSFPVTAIGGGYNWTVDVESDLVECTNFNSNGYKEYTPSYNGFSGSFESYWQGGTDVRFSDLANELLVIVLYTDNTANKNRYEGYAIINTNSVDVPNDDLVHDNCDFQGTGQLYYRVG
jgi:hypothetical protein